jgi:hypothetical protein
MINAMLIRSVGIILVVSAMSLFARNTTTTDTSVSSKVKQRKAVLIVKGNSYLENAIAKIIIDSLSRRGIDVRTTDLKTVSSAVPAEFVTILVFSAIKSSNIRDQIREFIKGVNDVDGDPVSNILICTVHGDVWEPKKSTVDAVTGATRTLDPGDIAKKIMKQINAAFSGDPHSYGE